MRKADSHTNIIAATVAQNPGMTGAEIEEKIGIPGSCRRLSEIDRLGLIKRGARRKCDVSGKTAITWYPDDREPDTERIETPKQKIRRLNERVDHLLKCISAATRFVQSGVPLPAMADPAALELFEALKSSR